MTTNSTPSVTQADRKQYAALWDAQMRSEGIPCHLRKTITDDVLTGSFDQSHEVQAFARHAHETRTQSEAASAATIAELVRAVEMLRSYGCPVCSGDCGSANPPVMTCPMQVAQGALAMATKHKARPDA